MSGPARGDELALPHAGPALARAGSLATAAGLLAHAFFVSVSIAGTQIGLGVAAAGLALCAFAGVRPRRTVLDLPILCLVLAAIASELLSPYGAAPLVSATLWRSAAGFWVVFQGLSLSLPGPQARRSWWLLCAMAAGLALASVVGIWQYRTGTDVVHLLGLRASPALVDAPGAPGRFGAMGFYTSRLTFGHVASVLLALLAGSLVGGIGAGHARGRTSGLWFAAALAAVAVLLTFDRAAWLGLGAGFLALLLSLAARARQSGPRRRGPLLAAALLALAVAGTLAAVPEARARLRSSFDLQGNSDRIFLWTRALEIIRDHPLSGIGFANYPRVCGQYYDRVDPEFFMRTWAHNSELSLLAETGPLGLLAGAWLVWAALRALWRRARQGDALALGALAAGATLLTIGQVHDVFYDTKVMYALWLALGLGLAGSPQAP